MIRVAVADDEQLVRPGLKLILGAAPDIEVVACCDGTDAVDRVRELRPDVLLLDIRMPEVDGLTVLRQVGTLTAPPAVIKAGARFPKWVRADKPKIMKWSSAGCTVAETVLFIARAIGAAQKGLATHGR